LFLILRFVFFEEIGKTFELVFGKSVGELVDNSRNLESLEEDSLLSLEEDVLRPSYISGQVSLGLDVSSDLVVSGSGLDEFGITRLFEIILLYFGHGL
jgi:hypothetical protein